MRDEGESRRRIVPEAEKPFAERGYGGASMDELERRAAAIIGLNG